MQSHEFEFDRFQAAHLALLFQGYEGEVGVPLNLSHRTQGKTGVSPMYVSSQSPRILSPCPVRSPDRTTHSLVFLLVLLLLLLMLLLLVFLGVGLALWSVGRPVSYRGRQRRVQACVGVRVCVRGGGREGYGQVNWHGSCTGKHTFCLRKSSTQTNGGGLSTLSVSEEPPLQAASPMPI